MHSILGSATGLCTVVQLMPRVSLRGEFKSAGLSVTSSVCAGVVYWCAIPINEKKLQVRMFFIPRVTTKLEN
jgi:hypothetical protein